MLTGVVIGYGNSLRRDDGVGPYIAGVVEGWQVSGWRSLSVLQLTPELVLEILPSPLVIFIDAGINLLELEVKPLSSQLPSYLLGHSFTPEHLLYLSFELYNHQPQAYQILIPGFDFELGESFSDPTAEKVSEALAVIRQLMEKGGDGPPLSDYL